jgi:hypothetical protein
MVGLRKEGRRRKERRGRGGTSEGQLSEDHGVGAVQWMEGSGAALCGGEQWEEAN